MSEAENKMLVRRYYEQVVSTGDVSRLEEFIAPQYCEMHEGVRYAVGLEGARAHILGVRETYSDLRIIVDRQIAEGHWVASCITASGTHVGRWIGIAPTGKPVRFSGVNIDRVVDGRIVEHGGAANLLHPLLEIGAVRKVE